MSDFFNHLAQRALGTARPLQPLVASVYAPLEPAADAADPLAEGARERRLHKPGTRPAPQREPRRQVPRPPIPKAPPARPMSTPPQQTPPGRPKSSPAIPESPGAVSKTSAESSPVIPESPGAVSETPAESSQFTAWASASAFDPAATAIPSIKPPPGDGASVPDGAAAAAPEAKPGAAAPLALADASAPQFEVRPPAAASTEQRADEVFGTADRAASTSERVPALVPTHRETSGQSPESLSAGAAPASAVQPKKEPERRREDFEPSGRDPAAARLSSRVSSPVPSPAPSPIPSPVPSPAPSGQLVLPDRALSRQLAVAMMKRMQGRGRRTLQGEAAAAPLRPPLSPDTQAAPRSAEAGTDVAAVLSASMAQPAPPAPPLSATSPVVAGKASPNGPPGPSAPSALPAPAAPPAPPSIRISIGRVELRAAAPPPPAAPARRGPPLSLAEYLKKQQGAR